jgi:hypothetical protein
VTTRPLPLEDRPSLAEAEWPEDCPEMPRSCGAHVNEVFSCQSITDYKHFLRFHVTKQGVTIYPIGIEKVLTNWELWMDKHAGEVADPGTEWIVPKKETSANRARLIEDPVEVR